jgi:transposase
VHVAVDALGNPVRLILSEGQVADITGAAWLIEGLDFEALIADKGYDADWLRNLVERFTGWAKHFRRVATRYEKTARNFLSFWTFVAVINRLK